MGSSGSSLWRSSSVTSGPTHPVPSVLDFQQATVLLPPRRCDRRQERLNVSSGKSTGKAHLNSSVSQTKLPEKCTRNRRKNVNFLQDVQEMMARLKPRPEQGGASKNRGKWLEHTLKLLESPVICRKEGH